MMGELPDVLGLSLRDARLALGKYELNIADVKVTSAPKERGREADDSSRVVRAELIGENKVILLVCNM